MPSTPRPLSLSATTACVIETVALPPAASAHATDLPPDIVRLLDVLARIERRRQTRLRMLCQEGLKEAS